MDKRERGYRPIILVWCKKCKQWVDEDETEFIDIEEDFEGRDLLTFRHCGVESKSLRRG